MDPNLQISPEEVECSYTLKPLSLRPLFISSSPLLIDYVALHSVIMESLIYLFLGSTHCLFSNTFPQLDPDSYSLKRSCYGTVFHSFLELQMSPFTQCMYSQVQAEDGTNLVIYAISESPRITASPTEVNNLLP